MPKRNVFLSFFQGDRSRNVVILNSLYNKEPMTNWVRKFLDEE